MGSEFLEVIDVGYGRIAMNQSVGYDVDITDVCHAYPIEVEQTATSPHLMSLACSRSFAASCVSGGQMPRRMSKRYCAKCLHGAYTDAKKHLAQRCGWAKCLYCLGWLMGLEPTTTGITILDSTN